MGGLRPLSRAGHPIAGVQFLVFAKSNYKFSPIITLQMSNCDNHSRILILFVVGERMVFSNFIDGTTFGRYIFVFERFFGHVAPYETLQQNVCETNFS